MAIWASFNVKKTYPYGSQMRGRLPFIRPSTEDRSRLKAESTLLDSEEVWLSYSLALKNHF